MRTTLSCSVALLLATALLPCHTFAAGKGSGGPTSVRGYVKKDGTYVQPHKRSAPDGSFSNNWTTKGNVNPYTGGSGTKASPSTPAAVPLYAPYLAPVQPVDNHEPPPAEPSTAILPGYAWPTLAAPAPVLSSGTSWPDASPSDTVLSAQPVRSGSRAVSSTQRMTAAELQSMELACLLAKTDGPGSYNQCLATQRASFAGAPPRPNLTELDYEDRQSLELACLLAKSDGPASYVQCQHRQVQSLSTAPARPILSGLTYAEQQSLDLACILAKADGPASLHRCLATHVKQLEAGPRSPDLSVLNSAERQSIELACILDKSDGPARYNGCLHSQLARLGVR